MREVAGSRLQGITTLVSEVLACIHAKAARPKGGLALCSAAWRDEDATASGAVGGSLGCLPGENKHKLFIRGRSVVNSQCWTLGSNIRALGPTVLMLDCRGGDTFSD